MILFAVWGLTSALWAPAMGFRHYLISDQFILFSLFIGIYLVSINLITTVETFRRFGLSFLLGSVLTGAIATTQTIRGIISDLSRAALPDQNVNIFGASMAIGFLLALYFFRTSKRVASRLLILAASFVLFVSLVLSGSRMAWVSIASALVIAAIAIKRTNWRRGVTNTILVMLLFGVGLYSFAHMNLIPQPMLRYLETRATLNYAIYDRMAGRLYIWAVGWEIAKHNPLIGVGLRNFPVVFEQHIPLSLKGQPTLMQPRMPHSVYLSVLAEMGLVGLVLFLLIVWWSFRHVLHCKDADHRFLALGLLLFVVIAGSVAELHIFGWMWLVLALSYAAARNDPTMEAQRSGTILSKESMNVHGVQRYCSPWGAIGHGAPGVAQVWEK
jgi:O-antigen ligase